MHIRAGVVAASVSDDGRGGRPQALSITTTSGTPHHLIAPAAGLIMFFSKSGALHPDDRKKPDKEAVPHVEAVVRLVVTGPGGVEERLGDVPYDRVVFRAHLVAQVSQVVPR